MSTPSPSPASSRRARCRAMTRSRTRRRSSTMCSANWRSPISAATISPMSRPTTSATTCSARASTRARRRKRIRVVSRGLLRSKTDKLMVVQGGAVGAARDAGSRATESRRAVDARLDGADEAGAGRRGEARRSADEGLCRRGLPGMREFHAGAEWDVFEVRDVRGTTGCS